MPWQNRNQRGQKARQWKKKSDHFNPGKGLPQNLDNLKGLNPENLDVCTIEGTVATGLESPARDECLEKLRSYGIAARGRIIFDVPTKLVHEVSMPAFAYLVL